MRTSCWQLAFVLLALAAGCGERAAPPAPAGPSAVARGPERAVWFADLGRPLAVSDADAASLLRHVAGRVAGDKPAASAFPAGLAGDTQPRIVFLSVSDGLGPARVVTGAGAGLAKAVQRAAEAMARLGPEAPQPKWIRLDLVEAAERLEAGGPQPRLDLAGGVHGLAWSGESGIALLGEEIAANGLLESGRLQPEKIRAYLRERRGANWAAWLVASREKKVWRFSTLGLFADEGKAVRLRRGRRDFSRLTRQDVLAAAKLAGEYLIRAVGEDGRFVYSYRADAGAASKSYNILRHAGTAWAMLELYEVTRDPRLLAAAERGVGHLLRQVRPGIDEKADTAVVVEDGHAKLGGNALAALTLATYTEVTGDRKHVPVALKLARWITARQGAGGEFLVHKQAHPGGRVSDFVSVYYPGEAALALARVARIDPEGKWLDAAERAGRYLTDVRDRDEVKPDQWQLYALNELYRRRRDERYLRQALRIARLIVRTQRRAHANADWVGSFLDPPRSTPTAVRVEGLCAAYSLARDSGRDAEAKQILEAARLGTAFQLRAQIRPELAMYLAKPQTPLGGIRGSLTSYRIRIDYVQHTISALLGLYRILGRQSE